MEPWYKVATPRKEVREGRSFNPDEFAIALEQVVAGTAPEDYRKPDQFFARTCFTRALREHAGMVLRRLSGRTENTAPVLTLITQFGGGKTHTLTALYHLATNGEAVGQVTRAWPIWCGRRALRPCRRRRSPCSWATRGIRARVARRRGSTSPASSRETRVSRRSGRRRRPRRPAPRRSRGCFRPLVRRCCCSSTRC